MSDDLLDVYYAEALRDFDKFIHTARHVIAERHKNDVITHKRVNAFTKLMFSLGFAGVLFWLLDYFFGWYESSIPLIILAVVIGFILFGAQYQINYRNRVGLMLHDKFIDLYGQSYALFGENVLPQISSLLTHDVEYVAGVSFFKGASENDTAKLESSSFEFDERELYTSLRSSMLKYLDLDMKNLCRR